MDAGSTVRRRLASDSRNGQSELQRNRTAHRVADDASDSSKNNSARVKDNTKAQKCPELEASFLSRVTYQWFTRYILSARDWEQSQSSNSGNGEDPFETTWDIQDSHRTDVQSRAFRQNLFCVVDSAGNQTRGSIGAALVKTFWVVFLSTSVWRAVGSILSFAIPLTMKRLLQYLNHVDSQQSIWVGLGYVFGLVLAHAMVTCILAWYHYGIMILGRMRIRSVLIAALYEKSLALSNQARSQRTVGEIVNLVSADAKKIMDLPRFVTSLSMTPVEIIIAVYLIYNDLGIASLSGFGLLVLLVPISAKLSTYTRSVHASRMRVRDKRLKVMNEVLNGIKVIKLYAWELGFKKLIDKARDEEISKLWTESMLRVVTGFIWFAAPILVTVVTFATYATINPDVSLPSEKAFVLLLLFHKLRMPLKSIPHLTNDIMRTVVALRRVDDFLSGAEEVCHYVSHDHNTANAIEVSDAVFSWEGVPPKTESEHHEKSEMHTLKDVNLTVAHGKLIGIIGQVGQGKSSLIKAILGNMKLDQGTVNICGRVAYVSQQPWLRNCTLRENVLFGKPFVEKRYWDILERCGLLEDIQILPSGDQTEIGEKGINLSGGQKQRISIARAVYSDADIVLMDDPLSAVDAQVGNHIFSKVIGHEGILRHKTRILVTHATQYLPKTDYIFVIHNGRISQEGTHDELVKKSRGFHKLIQQISVEQQQRENEETNDEERSIEPARKSSKAEQSEDSGAPVQHSGVALKHNSASASPSQTAVPMTWWSICAEYLKFIGPVHIFLVLTFTVATLFFEMLSNFWVASWKATNDGDTALMYRLRIFGFLGLGQGLTNLLGLMLVAVASCTAGQRFYDKLLLAILKAPMSFFESTPMGRIMNRFSSDLAVLDTSMFSTIVEYCVQVLHLLSTAIVICFNFPSFVVFVVPFVAVYRYIQTLYTCALRRIRRLKFTPLSPVFSHFAESLHGAAVIRAFGVEEDFATICNERIDRYHASYYSKICANRWLRVRLDACAFVMVFLISITAVIAKGNGLSALTPGTVGLCLTYASSATVALTAFIKVSSEVEINSYAADRVLEYVHLNNEGPWELNRPEADWPSQGSIEFKDYSTTYGEHLPPVVKSVNVKFRAGERIGICGRTGAGKSSLVLALFRILEASCGDILIDGIPISTVGLHDLRKKLAIIPQDPILFNGTLRFNLDPFGMHSEQELWRALEQAHLADCIRAQSSGLDMAISEGGQNLSVGQRQLLCITRALLRKSRVLVLDEATASVDYDTDMKIQDTISKAFKGCTVLTIAHRVNTILNYDRILVLDFGKVVEFDTPSRLLADPQSTFSSIVQHHGTSRTFVGTQ